MIKVYASNVSDAYEYDYTCRLTAKTSLQQEQKQPNTSTEGKSKRLEESRRIQKSGVIEKVHSSQQ